MAEWFVAVECESAKEIEERHVEKVDDPYWHGQRRQSDTLPISVWKVAETDKDNSDAFGDVDP
ncbi:MAG: hypothetical protein M3036_02075 [Bifidobacteriales bacterium]|nr:hypothetical protein [Bifidobacterium sp. W8114]MCT6836428.1 hypothetical protein [Bifidobacteriales bacterium]